ncbi:hypothetical protein U14_04077 [Candidatus Moduliflexus flocculans]|uniref:MotA/TolQ/ExbB proton channel domain-containing protein n=1 Tax=Candidatus Moduliflexus flocculans TaxID=1499966 RepID=A0A0S6W3E3_9BACT|nr:hypothetical protein U14_04077 [Candidatus Moduliflexus flocculans]
MKKQGFFFSEVVLTTIAYLLLLCCFWAWGYVFTSYNWEISALIFLLFCVGDGIVVFHLRKLYHEDNNMALFESQISPFRAATSRLLQQRHTLSPEALEQGFRTSVEEHFAIVPPSLIKTRLSRLSNMTLAGMLPDQDALSRLLVQQEDIKGSRVRYIAGILVMLGLLGTFLGLVQAVQYLQHFFMQKQTIDFNALFTDMQQTLGGLDKAFGTSIGGIAAYLVLGYLNIVLGTKQAYLLNRIEHVTIEDVLPIFWRFREKTQQDAPSQAVEILQTIPATLTAEIRAALEDVMLATIGGSSENLKITGEYLKQASEGVREGQQTFTQTVQAFGGFLSNFQDDGDRLISSQQAIASGVQQFSEALTHFEKNQQMLTASLDMTQGYIERSESRLGQISTVVEQMRDVWEHNRTVLQELAAAIKQEHRMLAENTAKSQEFLAMLSSNFEQFFQAIQHRLQAPIEKDMEIHQQLLESFALQTSLIHEMKRFIFDEQNGLRLLATGMNETFSEAKFQFHQLTEHFEELHKRLHEHQAQVIQMQDAMMGAQPRRNS